jgi:hypothetical protein
MRCGCVNVATATLLCILGCVLGALLLVAG